MYNKRKYTKNKRNKRYIYHNKYPRNVIAFIYSSFNLEQLDFRLMNLPHHFSSYKRFKVTKLGINNNFVLCVYSNSLFFR